MPNELFPFRFFDPIRNRWIQARYKASREEIAARYVKWEITGPGWTPSALGGSFVPFAKPSADDCTKELERAQAALDGSY